MGTTAEFQVIREWSMALGEFLPNVDMERAAAHLRGRRGDPPRAVPRRAAHRPVAARRRPALPRHRGAGGAGHVGDDRCGRGGHHAGGQRAAAVRFAGTVPHHHAGAQPRRDGRGQARRETHHHGPPLRRGRHHRHHPGCGAEDLRRHFRHADPRAGRHCVHQPGGGRRADHERDAGRREPAHRGNRAAQGAGRDAPADHRPVPDRGRFPGRARRRRRGGRGLPGRRHPDARLPELEFAPPVWAVGGALLLAMVCGVLFGILPARRAADLDPIAALAGR